MQPSPGTPPVQTAQLQGQHGAGASSAAAAHVDQDGYTLVTGKGKSRTRWTAAGGKAAAAETARPEERAGEQQACGDGAAAAATEAEADHGGGGDNGGLQAAAAIEGEACQDGDDGAPSIDELKAQMERDRQTVTLLAQRGYATGHPLVDEAERQAAASKAAWQSASPGAAVTRRLLWAEQALARAKKAQARTEQAIDDLDREYEAERDARVRQLHELRSRTREREAKLAEISREAAQEFTAAGDGRGGAGGHLQEAVGTIEGPLRDAVSEALASAPEGSALRTRLQGALGTLDTLRGLVENAAQPAWSNVYDMAQDDDNHWEEGPPGATTAAYRQQWYTPHWDQHWTDGGDDWHGAPQWGYGGHYEEGDGMDTTEVQAPSWYRLQDEATTPPPRAAQRRRIEGEDPNGLQGRYTGGRADGVAEHEAAARMQAEIGDAAAAASTTASSPAPPTPTAAEHALEQRKQEIWDMAQDQHVQVAVAEIAAMAEDELEAWASANLL